MSRFVKLHSSLPSCSACLCVNLPFREFSSDVLRCKVQAFRGRKIACFLGFSRESRVLVYVGIAQSIDTPTLAELVSKKQPWFARSRKELRLSHSLDLNFRVMHSLICSRNPGRPAGVDLLPSGFSLNGLEYQKLLYNSIVHGHRMHDPPWKRQSVQYREIRGRIKALTAKIQELKKRVASGETGRDVVDYYALMGLQRSWLKAGAPTGPPTADPQAQARQGPGWSSWRFRGRQR
ncbi:hypothetical protein SAY87_003385 [Trapa incisa]|uniref:Uncharacterized protein n=1 Tax=Trapa incisa TaxID=236973 RepID=A0AAN7QHY2_9MYRT|nr:hypothetical protein SAY87_003385 [Trapa incisa]